jgi:methionine sulfoxide reductase heme-binding subunit
VLHVTLFLMDKGWSLWALASEIVLRFYLTIGFVTLLGLVALGLTSNEAAIRKLGAKRWNRLHAIVYWLAMLALVHYFLQSKTDISQTLWAAGLFGLLMGTRGINRMDWPFSVPVLLGLAVAGTLGTALAEAIYYAIKNGANGWMVLANNLDPDLLPRPALIVALAGLALVGVKLAAAPRHSGAAKRSPEPITTITAN